MRLIDYKRQMEEAKKHHCGEMDLLIKGNGDYDKATQAESIAREKESAYLTYLSQCTAERQDLLERIANTTRRWIRQECFLAECVVTLQELVLRLDAVDDELKESGTDQQSKKEEST